MKKLKVWLLASRPKTLPAAIAPAFCGSAWAFYEQKFSWLIFILTILTSLGLQIGANFANDYYDFKRGSDRKDRLGPKRATATGMVSQKEMLNATIIILALSFFSGLYLIYLGGIYFAIMGILCILAALLYTAGPFALSYLGLGDLAVFIFFGLIAVNGTYYLHTQELSTAAFISSLGIGALTVNILVVNNTRDIKADQISHKKTLAVRFGKDFSLKELILMQILAFCCIIYISFNHLGALLALLSFPLGIKIYQELKNMEGEVLNKTLGKSGKMLLCYSLLLSLGIFI